MKTVELFAGSKSFSRVAAMYGCETFAVDWMPYKGINLVTDIGGLNLRTGLPLRADGFVSKYYKK